MEQKHRKKQVQKRELVLIKLHTKSSTPTHTTTRPNLNRTQGELFLINNRRHLHRLTMTSKHYIRQWPLLATALLTRGRFRDTLKIRQIHCLFGHIQLLLRFLIFTNNLRTPFNSDFLRRLIQISWPKSCFTRETKYVTLL